MSDLRKAAEMALKALENLNNSIVLSNGEEDVIKALRQALAQPEQEPVAWADKVGAVIPHSHKLFQPDLLKDYTRPLYTAPPKREWVDLTDDEINHTPFRFTMINGPGDALLPFARAVMAKLKEKNNA